MDLQRKRLIKQCQISLGEDFWTDFIFEDVDFNKPSEVKEAYTKWQRSYKDEYEIIQEQSGSAIDGRTKEFKEKLKDLLYKKEFAITEKQIKGLQKKSDESGIAYGILKKVFDRGMAAWKTGHRPGATPHQWAFARVNSFITGGKTRTTADKDLWAKHKGKKEDLEESIFGEELQEAKKVIAQIELWNGKKMKKSFKDQSSAERFIKKMQDQEDVRGYNLYAEDKHSGPCWDTHKMVGMKKKKGYPGMVPNCVPREDVEIDENRAIVYNPRMIRAFIKQVEKKFPKYKGEIQQADEPDEIVFPNDPKLIKFFKGAREVKFVLKDSVEIEEASCPTAAGDVELNTKNRDATIKKFNYGPLNVDEPGDYWEKIAKYWKTSEEAAKKSLCENCVAFDISPRMKDCMPGKTSDGDGELGYCWMHHFKCHSARSCHTWAKGGPISTDETSLEWQAKSKI